jgi:hypothetical protein
MKYGLILAVVMIASLLAAPVALAESPRDPHHMAKVDAHDAMEALMYLAKHPYQLKHMDAGKVMWLLKGVDHLSRLPYADHDKLFHMQVKLTLRLMDLQVKKLHRLSSYGPYHRDADYGYGYGMDKDRHSMDDRRGEDSHDKGEGDGHDEHGDKEEMGHGDAHEDDGDMHEGKSDMHGGDDAGGHDKEMMEHRGDRDMGGHKDMRGHGYYDYRYDMYKYYNVYYDYYKYEYKTYGKYGYGKYEYKHDYSYDYEYGDYHYFPKMWVHNGKPMHKPYSKYAHMSYKLDLDVHKMKYDSSYGCHSAQMSATRHHAWDRDIFVGPCEQVGYHLWTFNVWKI